MKIVTYATHSEGFFDELTSSGHDIKVLGWGTKWKGFMDKFKGIQEYIKEQPDNELIVYLDGFDSKINRDLSGLERAFESMNCGILVSHEDKSGLSNFLPLPLHRYVTRKVFGTCRGDHTANMGLYMGRAGDLKKVFQSIQGGTDDQREFNRVCSRFGDLIRVDTEKVIFENCPNSTHVSNAYFVQYPAALNLKRIFRSLGEYYEYFIPELLILVALIVWFMM
jgi:hypothetical protein